MYFDLFKLQELMFVTLLDKCENSTTEFSDIEINDPISAFCFMYDVVRSCNLSWLWSKMSNRLSVFNEAVGAHTLPKMLDTKTLFKNCYILLSEPCQLPSDLSDSGFKVMRFRSSPSCFERNKMAKLTLNVGGPCSRESLIQNAAPALFLQTENTPRCHNTTFLKNKKNLICCFFIALDFFFFSFLHTTAPYSTWGLTLGIGRILFN